MNAFEAFGNYRANAQQVRSLGGPVARRAGAVLLARKNDQRNVALGILHAGVEDRHLLAFGQQARNAAFGAGRELVAQTHIGKGPAHHHFVIAATRAVGVEVCRLHTMLGKILSRRPVGLDGAGGRDVVGGD